MNTSLRSSIGRKGKVVDQIYCFKHGNKKTWRGVLTDTIEQGEFTKFDTTDGRLVSVHSENVDWFETFAVTAQK